VARQPQLRIGIDLGGTKIEIMALDHSEHTHCYRQRIPTPNNYTETLAAIVSLVHQVESGVSELASVGVGIPGSICQKNQTVKNANSLWLNGQPFPRDLSRLLQREVRVANDANCFAVSEAIDGAGKGAHCVFGAIIGTGCGGGIVIDGQLLQGRNGLAGEWGHNPLPFPKTYVDMCEALSYFDSGSQMERSVLYQHKPLPEYDVSLLESSEFPGPQCYCGKRGCLETWISGTGLQNDYQRLTGESLTAVEIVQLARTDHAGARLIMTRYYERLAKSLAQIINVIDPDVIVLGGGMSNVEEIYQQVPHYWQAYTFTDDCTTRLVPAMHGDSSGVRGAAWLW
jgi:fructokinase